MDTVLWARSAESADRARSHLGDGVTVVSDLDALGDRSVVVEAVTEDTEVKSDLLGGLGVLLPGDSLIATTTSSLSVEELAVASGRPDRFGCMHVFNPVEKMALVELVFPEPATDATRATLQAVCEALGKTTIEVPDTPGFVVNRLLFPFAFEAVRLVESTGVDPKSVDSCMRLGAGHPIGPLAMLDLVGLDVAAAIGESIGAEVPQRVRDLIAEGKLGRKTKNGFFEYPGRD